VGLGLGPQSTTGLFGAQTFDAVPKDTQGRTFEVLYVPIDYQPDVGGHGKGKGKGKGGYGYDNYGYDNSYGYGKQGKQQKKYKYYLKQ
jgi:hypothetical protein